MKKGVEASGLKLDVTNTHLGKIGEVNVGVMESLMQTPKLTLHLLQYVVPGPDPITVLLCLPIALLAAAFGLRAGLLAAAAGVLLLVLCSAAEQVHLSSSGLVSRAVPMLLLGGLLGDAFDQLRRSEGERRRLEAIAQRHRDAVEFNDGVLQELAAAKWALEAGHPDRGLEIVTRSLIAAEDIVSEMLREVDTGAESRRRA